MEIGARLIGRRGTLIVDVPFAGLRDPLRHVPPVCQWFPADSGDAEPIDAAFAAARERRWVDV